jgi:hypothetical protein
MKTFHGVSPRRCCLQNHRLPDGPRIVAPASDIGFSDACGGDG